MRLKLSGQAPVPVDTTSESWTLEGRIYIPKAFNSHGSLVKPIIVHVTAIYFLSWLHFVLQVLGELSHCHGHFQNPCVSNAT